MAVFYPTLDVIQRFNPKPTEGEMHLLHFLRDNLSDEYEVYFNPYLNGDRPDVVVMRKNHGILIIEVKDWDLCNFRINEKRKWVYTGNGAIVKSPLDQVVKYKENLYDLHVENLLEFNIRDSRHFSMVSCAAVFIILEPKYNTPTEFNGSFDELLYTGITRSIRSLVVINFGNEEYHAKLGPIINSLK